MKRINMLSGAPTERTTKNRGRNKKTTANKSGAAESFKCLTM